MRPLGKISTVWSPNLAYAVGLLTSDGNLSSDGRHINLTSKDYELCAIFANCLRLQNKIGRKSSGYGIAKKYSVIQFGDILFYQWLERIGLTANKSKTIGALDIPDSSFFDFLRGLFDGDGTIYSYWDPRWHSSYMIYLGFISGSDVFLVWLQSKLQQLLSVNGHIAQGARAKTLRYAKKDSLKIIERMYYDSSAPRLERKYQKIVMTLRIERDHSPKVYVPVI